MFESVKRREFTKEEIRQVSEGGAHSPVPRCCMICGSIPRYMENEGKHLRNSWMQVSKIQN